MQTIDNFTALLEVATPDVHSVEIDGNKYFVREMSVRLFQAMQEQVADGRLRVAFYNDLIAGCLCDSAGKLIVPGDNVQAISEFSRAVIDELVGHICDVSGLNVGLEEHAKN